ncbi:MAG: hypothetical protein Q8M56_10775, partial [Desulfobacterales bacterium]|nr:hypothetical protein [Desulfobacterales bacterium]
DLKYAFRILRDHGTENYSPDSHFLGDRLCAHAANNLSRNATQTTGSIVAGLKQDETNIWATGTSAPCTSIFKPLWFKGEVIPGGGKNPGSGYDPDNLWWHHELLHRSILLDYETRINTIRKERDELEDSFIGNSRNALSGNSFEHTLAAFRKAGEITDGWIKEVKAVPVKLKPNYIYRKYWEAQNRKAGISL